MLFDVYRNNYYNKIQEVFKIILNLESLENDKVYIKFELDYQKNFRSKRGQKVEQKIVFNTYCSTVNWNLPKFNNKLNHKDHFNKSKGRILENIMKKALEDLFSLDEIYNYNHSLITFTPSNRDIIRIKGEYSIYNSGERYYFINEKCGSAGFKKRIREYDYIKIINKDNTTILFLGEVKSGKPKKNGDITYFIEDISLLSRNYSFVYYCLFAPEEYRESARGVVNAYYSKTKHSNIIYSLCPIVSKTYGNQTEIKEFLKEIYNNIFYLKKHN